MTRSHRILCGVALSTALLTAASAQQATSIQEKPMPHHAHGTFTVKMQPLTPAPAEGLMRMSIDKVIHGDLEATTKGEMISAGNPKAGQAGYVAMELVTGSLGGKTGTFALQHSATMDANGPKMHIIVAPGSGTGELTGIAGTFVITIDEGQHSYEFDYTLPSEH
jgi:hypothetical protein